MYAIALRHIIFITEDAIALRYTLDLFSADARALRFQIWLAD